jgi:hypothetical protein
MTRKKPSHYGLSKYRLRPTKETDVARPVVEWFRDMGWEVYQEVEGLNADIVAVLGRRIHIVECKRYLNFRVIRQAVHRLGFANWVSVAAPLKDYCSEAKIILEHYGIGCISVDGRWISEQLAPRINRRPLPAYVFRCLDDRQKTFCEAGSPGGASWSPFKRTCEMLRDIVELTPGIGLRAAIAAIKHHYANERSARTSLAHWIRLGKVRGIRAESGRDLKLYVDTGKIS